VATTATSTDRADASDGAGQAESRRCSRIEYQAITEATTDAGIASKDEIRSRDRRGTLMDPDVRDRPPTPGYGKGHSRSPEPSG
jgi:hypothetical protein